VQPEVLDLGQHAVQVRVVQHLAGNDGLGRSVVHGHVAERALRALRKPSGHPELVASYGHRLSLGTGYPTVVGARRLGVLRPG